MKFDLVEPSGEQVLERGAEPDAEESHRPGPVHPRLRLASARMRARIRADLTTLNASLGRLRENVETARHDDEHRVVGSAPPENFRAAAFSRRRGA